MTLKKYKINMNNKQAGQSVIEYTLLVAIAIIALIISANFISHLKDSENSAFERHFQSASWYIGGVQP